MKLVTSKSALLMAGLLILGVSSFSYAQRDAGAKALGEFGGGFWSNQSVTRHLSYSQGYAQGLHDYASNVQTITPQLAQPTSESLGRTLTASQEDLKALRKELDKDSAMKGRLDEIEKHLKAAVEHHKAVHTESTKEGGDAQALLDSCNDLIKELDKAQAEHKALLRKLSATKPAK